MQIKLCIFRFNPQTDTEPHYDHFMIEAKQTERLLDCLNRVRWTQDSTLAFRMSCVHGICGSDGLTVNGTAVLACQKLVKDFDFTEEIVVEPLRYFKVIKDLVVDLDPFFERIKSISPNQPNPVYTLIEVESERERLQTPQELAQFDDAIKCILCGCCYSGCPVITEQDDKFLGPAVILREHRYIFDSRIPYAEARFDILKKPHGIWGCKSYYVCTLVCPKKIRVTEAILRTKKKIISTQQPKQQ
jgi:succinate dehydrogenase / fumarate reductase iron-sulfur subunit